MAKQIKFGSMIDNWKYDHCLDPWTTKFSAAFTACEASGWLPVEELRSKSEGLVEDASQLYRGQCQQPPTELLLCE